MSRKTSDVFRTTFLTMDGTFDPNNSQLFFRPLQAPLNTVDGSYYALGAAQSNDPTIRISKYDSNGTYQNFGYLYDTQFNPLPPGPLLIVAAGMAPNTLVYSQDGTTWLTSSNGSALLTTSCLAVAYNGISWLAGGSDASANNTVLYSSNGRDWIVNTGASDIITNTCRAIASDGSLWLIGGNGTHVLAFSYDGFLWYPTDNGDTVFIGGQCNAVAYGDLWLAGASDTAYSIASSPDGIHWVGSIAAAAFMTNCYALGYNGSLWLAGGDRAGASVLLSSVDGINWIPVTFTAVPSSIRAISWNGTLWTVGGYDSAGQGRTLASSIDTYTWTPTTTRNVFYYLCNGITWEGSFWEAVGTIAGGGYGIATSQDGTVWLGNVVGTTLLTEGYAVAVNKALPFVPPRPPKPVVTEPLALLGGTDPVVGTVIAYSTDGITYNPSQNGTTLFQGGTPLCLTWNGSLWIVGLSDASANVGYSYDGIVWNVSATGSILMSNGLKGVAYDGSGLFIGVGQSVSSGIVIQSTDGIVWTTNASATGLLSDGNQAKTVAYNGLRWVAGNTGGTNRVIYSSNGITWTASSSGTSLFSTSCATFAWNGALWVAGGGTTVGYSSDGITWTRGTLNGVCRTSILSIAWNGSLFVIGGSDSGSKSIGYSYDGIEWFPANNTLGGTIKSVVWNGTLWIATGTTSISNVYFSYNGIEWSPSESGNRIVSTGGTVVEANRVSPYGGSSYPPPVLNQNVITAGGYATYTSNANNLYASTHLYLDEASRVVGINQKTVSYNDLSGTHIVPALEISGGAIYLQTSSNTAIPGLYLTANNDSAGSGGRIELNDKATGFGWRIDNAASQQNNFQVTSFVTGENPRTVINIDPNGPIGLGGPDNNSYGLTVYGNTLLSSNLFVNSNVYVNGLIEASGIHIEQSLDLSGSLTVGLTSHLIGNVGIGIDPSSNALDVSGIVHISRKLDVSGQTFLQGSVGIGRLFSANALDVSGTVHIANQLDVSGTVNISTVLDVSGTTYLRGPVGMGRPSTNNALDVSGIVHISTELDVSGQTILQGSVGIGRPFSANALDVSGVAHISTELDVSGLSFLQGYVGIGTYNTGPSYALDVSGTSRFGITNGLTIAPNVNSNPAITTTTTNNLLLGTNNDGYLAIGTNAIYPVNNLGANLGLTTNRWNKLYSSNVDTSGINPTSIASTTSQTVTLLDVSSSASGTVLVPSNPFAGSTYQVTVQMYGGGGGGANYNAANGGGGGSGALINFSAVSIVPGTLITYTVGAGGAGGVLSGTPGGDTILTMIISGTSYTFTSYGGLAGLRAPGASGGTGGLTGISPAYPSAVTTNGNAGSVPTGGGAPPGSVPYGNGGNGGDSGTPSGQSGTAGRVRITYIVTTGILPITNLLNTPSGSITQIGTTGGLEIIPNYANGPMILPTAGQLQLGHGNTVYDNKFIAYDGSGLAPSITNVMNLGTSTSSWSNLYVNNINPSATANYVFPGITKINPSLTASNVLSGTTVMSNLGGSANTCLVFSNSSTNAAITTSVGTGSLSLGVQGNLLFNINNLGVTPNSAFPSFNIGQSYSMFNGLYANNINATVDTSNVFTGKTVMSNLGGYANNNLTFSNYTSSAVIRSSGNMILNSDSNVVSVGGAGGISVNAAYNGSSDALIKANNNNILLGTTTTDITNSNWLQFNGLSLTAMSSVNRPDLGTTAKKWENLYVNSINPSTGSTTGPYTVSAVNSTTPVSSNITLPSLPYVTSYSLSISVVGGGGGGGSQATASPPSGGGGGSGAALSFVATGILPGTVITYYIGGGGTGGAYTGSGTQSGASGTNSSVSFGSYEFIAGYGFGGSSVGGGGGITSVSGSPPFTVNQSNGSAGIVPTGGTIPGVFYGYGGNGGTPGSGDGKNGTNGWVYIEYTYYSSIPYTNTIYGNTRFGAIGTYGVNIIPNYVGGTQTIIIPDYGSLCIGAPTTTSANNKFVFYDGATFGPGNNGITDLGYSAYRWKDIWASGTITGGTKSFLIDHPDPSLNATHYLRHSTLETPTSGDNVYRWILTTTNKTVYQELPSYSIYLNKNWQFVVSPTQSFGAGYVTLASDEKSFTLTVNEDGAYSIIGIATRKDKDALHLDKTPIEYLKIKPDENQ